MTNQSIYRELAADGNQDARVIADAMGAMPSEEMPDDDSEEIELQELEGLEAHLHTLIARAEISTQAGTDGEAAKTHFERGQTHELAADAHRAVGNDDSAAEHHRSAKDAYRDAAFSLAKHINKFGQDCGYAEGYSLPQIRAIHWRENQEE
jgi:uncharacterized protein (DUF3084 family)